MGIDAVIELSQSAKGAHVWIFFGNLVYAKKARLLGDYILLNAMSANKSISFKSYDRFFHHRIWLIKMDMAIVLLYHCKDVA